jgi:DNA-directed RNA polymerase subunit RPC12/RpoP
MVRGMSRAKRYRWIGYSCLECKAHTGLVEPKGFDAFPRSLPQRKCPVCGSKWFCAVIVVGGKP